MNKLFRPATLPMPRLLLVAALMLASVAAAEYLRPTAYWADHQGEPKYETIAPAQFGNWQEMAYGAQTVVDPVQEDNLRRIYSQTFARSFLHKPTGRVIMLSIAYGRDQSNDTQLHTPDMCYPSQGFKVLEQSTADVPSSFGPIPAVRLVTAMGDARQEPLTYFIRVGEGLTRGSRDRNIERIRLALKGYKTDGMLFRVSEVTRRDDAFALQNQFIEDFMRAVSADNRKYFLGRQGT